MTIKASTFRIPPRAAASGQGDSVKAHAEQEQRMQQQPVKLTVSKFLL
jgi:hypothetical protein